MKYDLRETQELNSSYIGHSTPPFHHKNPKKARLMNVTTQIGSILAKQML